MMYGGLSDRTIIAEQRDCAFAQERLPLVRFAQRSTVLQDDL